jgi:tRNA (cmo5U34)-methyltransferase
MAKDKLFSKKRTVVQDFNFGHATALVFDDMLQRSVPFYAETQRMMAEIAADYAQPGTCVVDLGCSTGTTLMTLDHYLPPDIPFVGVDYSEEMLGKAREKLGKHGVKREVEFVCRDLNQGAPVHNASVVILNLTLQFVRPLYRQNVIRQIADGLHKDGCLLLVEKVLSADSNINRFFIKYYYDFKQRNGYSQMEISQKREALENVLIPYQVEEDVELLKKNGFPSVDIFFKWYNFCGFLAHK